MLPEPRRDSGYSLERALSERRTVREFGAAALRLDELGKAGALYQDSEAVVDGNLVASRRPADLPVFMRAALRLLRAPASEAAELADAAV